MTDDNKFIVVPMGKESKAITQVISNDTSLQVMDLLADGPMSISTVAEKLGIPLSTAQYNIDKLMEVGLVKIEKTKYSEKGRVVNLYRVSQRFIMIVPEKSGGQAAIDALKKYILLIPVAAALSLAMEYLVPASSPSHGLMGTHGPAQQSLITQIGQHSGALIFTGCLLAICLLITIEYALHKNNKKK